MNNNTAFNNLAAAYVRVSTDEQVRGGVSLEAQEERLRAYCLASGLELVQLVREEGVSGAKALDTRPGGKDLLELASARRVHHVIALKLDRLFRDAQDALYQTRNWDRAGIALHLVDLGGQSINTHSAIGRMLLTLLAAFAELERNLISERTAAALAHKKRHGQVYGAVPFGFERRGQTLIPIAQEQVIVRIMRSWRDAGQSYRQIAAALNDREIPAKTGGLRWHATTVRKILLNSLHATMPRAA